MDHYMFFRFTNGFFAASVYIPPRIYKMKAILLFCLLLAINHASATVYLTTEDFKEQTTGMKAIVAFKAPWCGHCKRLKPIWDELADKVDVLVGEVDCTVEKDLCLKQGVQGYPTIKYTTGQGWKKYQQGRDLETFEKFIRNTLRDGCLQDESLCTEEETQKLEDYKKLSVDEIHKRLENVESERESADILFKGHVEKLQRQYQTLQNEKDNKLDELGEEEAYLRYVLNLPKEEL